MFALVAVLLAVSAADAARTEPFSEGRLWRISRAGIGDSFVFGTIHVADPRVAEIPKPVRDAIERCRTLAIELVPEAAEGQVLELEQLDDGRRLEPLIGAAAFAQLREALAGQQIPLAVVERMKPWAAMVKITRIAGAAPEASLDEELLAAARARAMHVASLELVDEQIAAFDAVPLDSQIALLTHAIAHRDALAATVEPTIEAWLRGDLAELARIPQRFARQYPGLAIHFRAFAKHVVVDRTVLMHYRLFMPLREGRVFTAIGATHLYGTQGLLALLQRDGYRVTKVW